MTAPAHDLLRTRTRARAAALEALLVVARRSANLVTPLVRAGAMETDARGLLAFLDAEEAELFAAAEAIGPALDDLFVARLNYDRVRASYHNRYVA